MSTQRVGISKGKRFGIFARDGFTCRYCGRQSDVVVLEVDHVIPVCQGGTNDEANLVTSCKDCNAGKSGKTILQSAPTETDRLRIAQEHAEQLAAATAARGAAAAREQFRQSIVDYWCELTGRDSMDRGTLGVMARYGQDFGIATLFDWMEKARHGTGGGSDEKIGRYISGIRKSTLEEAGE